MERRKRAISRARARRYSPPRTFRMKGGGCLTYIILGAGSVLAVVGGMVFI